MFGRSPFRQARVTVLWAKLGQLARARFALRRQHQQEGVHGTSTVAAQDRREPLQQAGSRSNPQAAVDQPASAPPSRPIAWIDNHRCYATELRRRAVHGRRTRRARLRAQVGLLLQGRSHRKVVLLLRTFGFLPFAAHEPGPHALRGGGRPAGCAAEGLVPLWPGACALGSNPVRRLLCTDTETPAAHCKPPEGSCCGRQTALKAIPHVFTSRDSAIP